jgi:hypothetical protein
MGVTPEPPFAGLCPSDYAYNLCLRNKGHLAQPSSLHTRFHSASLVTLWAIQVNAMEAGQHSESRVGMTNLVLAQALGR